MVEGTGQILYNLDPKVKDKDRKAGIYHGVPLTAI